MMYVYTAMVKCYLKKASAISSLVHGHETRHRCFKRPMVYAQNDEYTYIRSNTYFSDNMSALHIMSRPESVLRKKSHSSYYYTVCNSVAMDESFVGHITRSENVADLRTKVINEQIKIKDV